MMLTVLEEVAQEYGVTFQELVTTIWENEDDQVEMLLNDAIEMSVIASGHAFTERELALRDTAKSSISDKFWFAIAKMQPENGGFNA